MKVSSKEFVGHNKKRDEVFAEASDFATGLGKDNVISIAFDVNEFAILTVVVWYWDE